MQVARNSLNTEDVIITDRTNTDETRFKHTEERQNTAADSRRTSVQPVTIACPASTAPASSQEPLMLTDAANKPHGSMKPLHTWLEKSTGMQRQTNMVSV